MSQLIANFDDQELENNLKDFRYLEQIKFA